METEVDHSIKGINFNNLIKNIKEYLSNHEDCF